MGGSIFLRDNARIHNSVLFFLNFVTIMLYA